jgi:hypothetical protein
MFIAMFFNSCTPEYDNDYQVYEKAYTGYDEEQGEYAVKYLQVSGIDNKKLEEKINETLRLSVTEWLNEYCAWMERSKISIECQSAQYFSVCYTIEWKNKNGEDLIGPKTRIGVTVDMSTGERVFLDDLLKDTDSLKQRLENYDYGNEYSPPISTEEADNIIYCASLSEKEYLEEEYKSDPHVYDEIKSVLSSKSSFYLTGNKLIITRDDDEWNNVSIDFSPEYDNEYQVYEKEYTGYNEEKEEYTVKYLQISGLDNRKLEKKINKALRLSVTEWLNEHCEEMKNSKIFIPLQSSKYLSIYYTIEWTKPDPLVYVTPCTRIGITIDMRAGKRLFLDDFIKDKEDLKQKLMSYYYECKSSPPIDSEEAERIIDRASMSEKEYLKERSKSSPYVYDLIMDYIGEKPSFYITDTRLVITKDLYEPDDVYIDLQ